MKCPNCKQAKMVKDPDLGKGWFRCPNCGTRWIKELVSRFGGERLRK